MDGAIVGESDVRKQGSMLYTEQSYGDAILEGEVRYTGTYPEEGRAPKAADLIKPGEWNRIRVEAKGDTFTVWINGEPSRVPAVALGIRTKETTHPKFFLFDTGVARAAAGLARAAAILSSTGQVKSATAHAGTMRQDRADVLAIPWKAAAELVS